MGVGGGASTPLAIVSAVQRHFVVRAGGRRRDLVGSLLAIRGEGEADMAIARTLSSCARIAYFGQVEVGILGCSRPVGVSMLVAGWVWSALVLGSGWLVGRSSWKSSRAV